MKAFFKHGMAFFRREEKAATLEQVRRCRTLLNATKNVVERKNELIAGQLNDRALAGAVKAFPRAMPVRVKTIVRFFERNHGHAETDRAWDNKRLNARPFGFAQIALHRTLPPRDYAYAFHCFEQRVFARLGREKLRESGHAVRGLVNVETVEFAISGMHLGMESPTLHRLGYGHEPGDHRRSGRPRTVAIAVQHVLVVLLY